MVDGLPRLEGRVAELYRCTVHELRLIDSLPERVEARMLVTWVAREAWGAGWSEMGRLMGRDHTTIMKRYDSHKRAMGRSHVLKQLSESLLQEFRG